MNDARHRNYCGPTEAAVLMTDSTIVRVPDLRDWMGSHQILSALQVEKVAATFCKAPNGGWGGTASVVGLRGTHNIYTCGAVDDLTAAVEEMARELLTHNTRMDGLRRDKAAKLEALLSSHDWYSAYSDAPGVALAGDHDWDTIRSLMSEVDPTVTQALFAKYAPQECSCPV
jgi:hypothetical protein